LSSNSSNNDNGDGNNNNEPPVTMAIIVKLFTYVFSVVSEDVDSQKRGIIFVFSTNEEGRKTLSDPSDKMEYSLYREGSPVRRSCTHFCLPENNRKMRIVRAVMMLAMAREERIRTRIHMDGKLCYILYSCYVCCYVVMLLVYCNLSHSFYYISFFYTILYYYILYIQD